MQSDQRQIQLLIGSGLSRLPAELEAEIRALSEEQAIELFNRLSPDRRRLLGVSDAAQIAQRLEAIDPGLIRKELDSMKRSEIATAPTAELVKVYNEITGKSIKKFSSREAAERQVARILPKENSRGRKPKTTIVAANAQGNGKLHSASERAAL